MAILNQSLKRRVFVQTREMRALNPTLESNERSPSSKSGCGSGGKRKSGSPSAGSGGDEASGSTCLKKCVEDAVPMYKKRRMTARSYRLLLKPTYESSDTTPSSIQCSRSSNAESNRQSRESRSCDATDLGTHSKDMAWLKKNDRTSAANRNPTYMEDPIQTDCNQAICVKCKRPGLLLHCFGKGCKASYHLACLDPPLNDFPPGLWLCFCCLRRKMEFGVYSVSEGIESIWDSKDEMQKEKHYLVKYKALAHVYNRWIPESQLLIENRGLLATFNKKWRKEQVKKWKHEWTEPNRLLQKRFLMPPKQVNECSCGHGSNVEYCYHEWLVKWEGLGYEHATWEFENSPFLSSEKGKTLINDYERLREEAKQSSDPSRADRALQLKDNPFTMLPRLPDGFLSEFHSVLVDSVKSILECWHRSQNAILIDDQERIAKSITFILNLLPYTCRPFLVISNISSLALWEAEFHCMVPFVNVVVYNGDKNVRKMIQTLEFYEEGGCIMFQVLVAPPTAIIEDFEVLDCIGWEAIIIDDCQMPGISKHFEKFAMISSEFRLLLSNSPLKDNIFEYLNLLLLLDPRGQEDPASSAKFDSIDSTDELDIAKERLAQYIVFKRKRNSLNFVEYWVPVELCNLQLQQYCGILTSNSHALRSRVDYVQALFDVLVSVRKCCDHPYLVDNTLDNSLTKNLSYTERLDVGVNASGKLQLLDEILYEMNNRSLKILILFQSDIGSARNCMGDILFDVLHQRFGEGSLAYVNSRSSKSNTDAILQKFNNMRQGFIVLESRACRPRIKLSSVDAVIIYGSDWNPLNDLKALKKISIDSSAEQVKVFRLYSPYTVEERVLMVPKDGGLDVDIESASHKLKHSLLSWGASNLFSKLVEFQQSDSTDNCQIPSVNTSIINDMLDLLTQPSMNIDVRNGSSIVKAEVSGTSYSSNDYLYGEKENPSLYDGEKENPTILWSKLLEKHPWKFKHVSVSPTIRRNIHCVDNTAKFPDGKRYGSEKKSKVDGVGDTTDHALEAVEADDIQTQKSEFLMNQSDQPAATAVNDVMHEGNSMAAPSPCQDTEGCLNSVSPNDMVSENPLSVPVVRDEMDEGETRGNPALDNCSEQITFEALESLNDNLLKKKINLIEKVFQARQEKIILIQKREVEAFKNKMEEDMQKLKRFELKLEMLHSDNGNEEVGEDIRKLEQEFYVEKDRYESHIKCQRNKLRVLHVDARNRETQLKNQWLEEAKAGRIRESFTIPLSASGFRLEKFKFSEHFELNDDMGNVNVSGPCSNASTKTKPEEFLGNLRQSVEAINPNESINDNPFKKQMRHCKSKSWTALDSICNSSAVNLGDEFLKSKIPASDCEVKSGISVESADCNLISIFSATNPSTVPCDKLLQTETLTSDCNVRSGMAVDLTCSANCSQILTVISETNSSRLPCDKLRQTETPALCSADSGIAVCSSGLSSILSNDEIANIHMETELPTCQLKSLKAVEAAEPSRISPHIPSVVCVGAGDSSIGTETPLSVDKAGNVTGGGLSRIDPDSGKSTEQYRETDYDVVKLTSSHTQTNLTTLLQVSDCTGHDNCAPLDKVPPGIDLESPDNAIPMTFSGDPESIQDQCSIHKPASDPILQQLPPTSLTLVTPSLENSLTVVGSGQGQLNNVEFPRSELVVSTSLERMQSNIQFPRSLRLPTIPDIPSSSTQQGGLANPLLIEMNRLSEQEQTIIRSHEEKKMNIQLECEIELEKVKSKYASLIQDADAQFTCSIKEINRIQSLIYKNQLLADEFREKFFKEKQGASPISQGSTSGSTIQQFQSPRPEISLGSVFTSPSELILAPTPPSLSSWSPAIQHFQLPRPEISPRTVFTSPSTLHALTPPPVSSSPRPPIQQFEPPRPEISPRPVSTSPSTLTRAPSPSSVSSSRLPTPSSIITSVPLRLSTHQTSAFADNLLRPQINPMLQARSVPRAPAPHLRVSRPPPNMQVDTFQVVNPHVSPVNVSTSLPSNVGPCSFSPANISSTLPSNVEPCSFSPANISTTLPSNGGSCTYSPANTVSGYGHSSSSFTSMWKTVGPRKNNV